MQSASGEVLNPTINASKTKKKANNAQKIS